MPVAIPYPDRAGRYAGLRAVDARSDIEELYRNGAFNLLAMFRDALSRGVLEGDSMARDMALAFEQVVRSSRNQLANVHHLVGEAMQRDTVAAYQDARATLGSRAPSYRLTTRDAGGRLLRALGSPAFFRATYDGIGFANITLLDRAARQWYRLNFGARPHAGARPGRFQISWQGLVVGSLGFDNPASRPFMLPRGFWRDNTFGPTGPTPLYTTKGIRAWNFLDAGLEAATREIPPAYERLHGQWMASAQRGLGPLSRVVQSSGRGPRPRAPVVG